MNHSLSPIPPLSVILFASSVLAISPPEALCQSQPKEEVRDFRGLFEGMNGAFVLYDAAGNRFIRHNPEQCSRRLSPASTFKILNSLIGLETGVIPDEHYIIPWDSVRRSVADWNRSHDLETAIRHSVVWYYQELARRVGTERMNEFVQRANYGNMDVSGPIDRFWLGSSLLISANEQIEFLKRLHDDALPFSKRSMGIVRRILVLEQTGEYVLRGKTGFSIDAANSGAGWFVGYLERGGQIYYFATNIVSCRGASDTDRIMAARKPVTLAILKELGLL